MDDGRRETAIPANVDDRVVADFGSEWARFPNSKLGEAELAAMFHDYAAIFPWDELPPDPIGFDAGCGSGRWARFFAPRVGRLHCVDASHEALDVARSNLTEFENVRFHHEDLTTMSLEPASCDFGYSLGVLHHVPDTERALRACVDRLKPGAPFLLYLYYDLEDARPIHRMLLRGVTGCRRVSSRLPRILKVAFADVVAVVAYYPMARLARLVERSGRNPAGLPLHQYRHRSLSVMRNDALDRFGTRLEKRFSRVEVRSMMEAAGLEAVEVADGPPWWVAVGRRSSGER